MAQKRMFSLRIVDTDRFLNMPSTSQALYFHLGMRADDDGFVGNPERIARMVSANIDDLNVLALRGYIYRFDSGICVIMDWHINNQLRGDRYQPTIFQEEYKTLTFDSNKIYKLPKSLPCIPLGNQMTTNGIQNGNNIDSSTKSQKTVKSDNLLKSLPCIPVVATDLDLGLDLDLVNTETTNVVSCSEHLASQNSDPTPAPKKPETKLTEFKIPLVSNNPKTGQKLDYAISQKDFDEWVTAFPAVDIAQELRKMRQWSLANPTKAKTGRGINAFIVRWLSRAQDSGGTTLKQAEVQSSGDRATPRRMTFPEQEELRRLQGIAKLRYEIEGEAGLRKFCEEEKLDFDEVKKWI